MVEPDAGALEAFVRAFRDASGYTGAVGHFTFGDSPEMADRLGRLVLDGPKRATAGWVDDEDGGAEGTTAGDHDIVLAGDGTPLCLIATTEVRTLPFREADPAFAWDEGEGDRTLAWWRDAHLAFFSRRAQALGTTFTDDSLVAFERFDVVWPPLPPEPPLATEDRIVVRPLRPDDRAWVRSVTPEVADDQGWAADRLPGLLARADGRTAGALVFHPRPNGVGPTTVVATALLEQADDVEEVMRRALKDLARRHRWGHPTD